jgi:predicted CXXCH cytochrome family protein
VRKFAPAGAAEMAGVKFIDGRVDCISCHDLTNTDRYHLRIENRKSRLCLACHLK